MQCFVPVAFVFSADFLQHHYLSFRVIWADDVATAQRQTMMTNQLILSLKNDCVFRHQDFDLNANKSNVSIFSFPLVSPFYHKYTKSTATCRFCCCFLQGFLVLSPLFLVWCLCVRASVCACVRLPGACRCCIMAWSIRESARVTQRITAAWSRPRKRPWEKWQLRSAALIQADRNIIGEISFICFKVLSSVLMTYFGFISSLIRKGRTCKHETLLRSNRSWQSQF